MMPLLYILISLALMPFFTSGRAPIEKVIFLLLSIGLTPLLGIPIYIYIRRH